MSIPRSLLSIFWDTTNFSQTCEPKVRIDSETSVKASTKYKTLSSIVCRVPFWKNFRRLSFKITVPHNMMYLPPVNYKVQYHSILTKGPPISSRLCRFLPCRLDIARKEVDLSLSLGIRRPSSNPWTNPLHIIPESDGFWRPYEDYRALMRLQFRIHNPFCTSTSTVLPIPWL